MIERRQVMDWLDARLPVEDLLVTPPAHVFFVKYIGRKPIAIPDLRSTQRIVVVS